jgi:inward rectifier potassium channel
MAFNKKFKSSKNIKEINDLGLGSKVIDSNQRIITKEGKYNIERKGIPFLQSFSFYHYLISISWIKFCSLILIAFVIINIIFALLYLAGGVENFEGIETTNTFDRFVNEFFFSTQTFTTVGYGRINPVGVYSNIISSIESLGGLLSLALATGLLYGRFSRPYAKILYSEKALIAPFRDSNSFQFRIANLRENHDMIDVEIEVILSKVENDSRKFYNLKLEYKKISFFSASWTVNHIIDEESPLLGMTEKDMKDTDVEFLILLKGFDDTFAQYVNSRFSYRFDEVVWGAKFINIYGKTEEGRGMVELDKISEYEKATLNQVNAVSIDPDNEN